MKKQISNFAKDPYVSKTLKFFLVILAGFIIVGMWKWNKLSPELPLFYSLPRGKEQLGTPVLLLLLPFISCIVYGVNFLAGSLFFAREKLGSVLLAIIGTIIPFLFLVTFVKIVFLIS